MDVKLAITPVDDTEEEPKECCRERSLLEKCLLLILIVVVCVIIALLTLLFLSIGTKTCDSPECVAATAELLQSMDLTQKPCEDFYTYVCGSNYKTSDEVFSIELSPEQRVEKIINDSITVRGYHSRTSLHASQRIYYQACFDVKTIDTGNDSTFLDILDTLGGWPVTKGENWNKINETWAELIVRLKGKGFIYEWFFDFELYEDKKYTNLNILKIRSPHKHDDIHLKQDYINLFSDIAVSWGASWNMSSPEILRTVAFEEELLREIKMTEQDVLEIDQLMTVSDIRGKVPGIDWYKFFFELTGAKFGEKDMVLLSSLKYLQRVNRLLQGTPNRILQDYVIWKIIQKLSPFLSWQVRGRIENFNRIHNDNWKQPKREDFCLTDSKNEFPYAAEIEFLRNNAKYNKRSNIVIMMNNIKQQLINQLNTSTWMDTRTKTKAIDKVKGMKEIFGGPKYLFEEGVFERTLGLLQFEFTSKNIIEIVLERNSRRSKEKFFYLNDVSPQPMDVSGFNATAAFPIFDREINRLVIPPRLFQDEFFNLQRPNYFNYAILGNLITRALLQGFGEAGSFSTVNGRSVRWWEIETINRFHNQMQCVKDELQNFSSNLRINEPFILEKSFTDFIAADLTYMAYKQWVKLHGIEKALPGFPQTPHQIFWIDSAKPMCQNEEYLTGSPFVDEENSHLFSRYRILASFRNSKYFGVDFTCPDSSYMNPKTKCQIL